MVNGKEVPRIATRFATSSLIVVLMGKKFPINIKFIIKLFNPIPQGLKCQMGSGWNMNFSAISAASAVCAQTKRGCHLIVSVLLSKNLISTEHLVVKTS